MGARIITESEASKGGYALFISDQMPEKGSELAKIAAKAAFRLWCDYVIARFDDRNTSQTDWLLENERKSKPILQFDWPTEKPYERFHREQKEFFERGTVAGASEEVLTSLEYENMEPTSGKRRREDQDSESNETIARKKKK